VDEVPGGSYEAHYRLNSFLEQGLPRYNQDRNQPTAQVTTGLSPHLHFGHISAFEIVRALLEKEQWSPDKLSESTKGSREGWWGVSPEAEAFLDQVVTWRTLGFNTCQYLEGYQEYASLPQWARTTLEAHADDPREHVYTLEQFNNAQTHDELWNAAQRQLVSQGYIHNYMRMLWGKKILEWTQSPKDALEIMIELNNRYGLDGRDPNSYSGIFWVLGRHDRAFGPERDVLGKVRYMSSQNTARKLRVKPYLARWGR
jgi:deoxyribodipyrimidine photo-lyase